MTQFGKNEFYSFLEEEKVLNEYLKLKYHADEDSSDPMKVFLPILRFLGRQKDYTNM